MARPAAAAGTLSADALEDGEIVLLAVRPSLWFIPLSSRWTLAALVLLAALVFFGAHLVDLDAQRTFVIQGLVGVAVLRLAYALYQWATRWYVLTNRRVFWLAGGARPLEYSALLTQIEENSLEVSAGQRVLGLGNLHLPTRGEAAPTIVWHHLRRPEQVRLQVQNALDAARNNHRPL